MPSNANQPQPAPSKVLKVNVWLHYFQGHPQLPLATGQTAPSSVRLTIMTLAWSTSDRAGIASPCGASEHGTAECAEVVVADEVGVYHCVQRVMRRAFLCGVDPLSGNSYDRRRTWIRDRLESLAGLFGVEIAAFAVMSNHLHVILRNRPDVVTLWSDQEVARRWLAVFPGRVGNKPNPTFALAALPGPTAEQARSISPGTPAMPPGREPADPLEQAVGMLSGIRR